MQNVRNSWMNSAIDTTPACDRLAERERERVYFTITNTRIIHNKNKAKGGLPEEAKAHRAGHPLLRYQQINKNKWG